MTPPARPPRRILMTADAVGGVWNYALTLATGLRAHDVETLLAVMGPRPSPTQRKAASNIDGLTLVESDFKLEWMDDADDDVERAGGWLLDLAQRFAPDLVHLNGYAHAALPWSVPCVAVAHSCVVSWWSAVKRSPLPPAWSRYADRVRRGLAQADLVIAPSFAFADDLRRFHGRRDKLLVIHNGCDPCLFSPDFKQPFILAAGRLWDEAKNIAVLDAVAPRIDWPIFVAGGTRSPQGPVAASGLLHALGALAPDEMADTMGRASIFVSPARYEPFGLAVLEAALSGCALVLSDIPSFRELWQDVALFVPADDQDALTDALRMLCANRDLVHASGRRAWSRAQHFTAARMVDAYATAYAALLAPAGEAARRHEELAVTPG